MNLQQKWVDLCCRFTSEKTVINSLWKEIETQYTGKNRHYHNLNHLEDLHGQAETFQAEIADREVLEFSIWYHDLIYNPLRKDNELQSALRAKKRLSNLKLSKERIEKCFGQIVATQSHEVKNDSRDDQFLMDFDLSILGSDWDRYWEYTQKIRQEYWIYPDLLYRPGRKKALQHFLEKERLFYTSFYQDHFEAKARENIARELDFL